jgi:class 3 adenylate cyclase
MAPEAQQETREKSEPERLHTTVLFVDIVDSTRLAVELGDREWLDLQDAHEGMLLRELDRFDGRCVRSLGDGVLAVFDSPAAGVCCAARMADTSRSFGIEVRAGLHAGECERRGGRLGGIVFHVGARVVGCARANEVLVSRAVKDRLSDGRFVFADRGSRRLKGLPGAWPLFALEGAPPLVEEHRLSGQWNHRIFPAELKLAALLHQPAEHQLSA